MRSVVVTDIPPDTVRIGSSILKALPRSLVVFPGHFEGQIKAVLGLASLNEFAHAHLTFLEQLTDSISIVLNSIEATMQTEELLKQSQQLAVELQTRQEELQQSNEQLEQKAQQLAEQNVVMGAQEPGNRASPWRARRKGQGIGAYIAVQVRVPGEHVPRVRTPLNSILILGQQLGDNVEGNLSPKQVEFARTIHGAGTDLLNLISDILDLSKIESGTVTVDAEKILLREPSRYCPSKFRHEAESRDLTFDVQVETNLGKNSRPTPSDCSRS